MFSYRYFNPNPRGAVTGDCVKRAIVVATGMDYRELEKSMNANKRNKELAYNCRKNWEHYLRVHLKFTKIGYVTPAKTNTWHVTTIDKVLGDYPHLTFVLRVTKHLIGIKNNTIYDLDSNFERDKMVFNVWVCPAATQQELDEIKFRLNNDERPLVVNEYTMITEIR